MQIPKRRSEEQRRALQRTDHLLTPEAIERIKNTLLRLKKKRPNLVEEISRTQAMGDLSENAGYQDAKSRLRRNNSRILSLEDRIKNAIPILIGASDGTIRIGSTVTCESNGREQTFTILGSQESDPAKGRISYSSPLGAQLMGMQIGQHIERDGQDFAILSVQ